MLIVLIDSGMSIDIAWNDQLYSNSNYVFLTIHGRPFLILGSKTQWSRSQVRVVYICP